MPIRKVRIRPKNWFALRSMSYNEIETWAVVNLWARKDLGSVARIDAIKIDEDHQQIVVTYLALGGVRKSAKIIAIKSL